MTPSFQPNAELLCLINAACSDTATAEQVELLEKTLRASEEACLLYLRYFSLESELHFLGKVTHADRLSQERVADTLAMTADRAQPLPPLWPASEFVDTASAPVVVPLGGRVENSVGYFSSGWPVAYLVATLVLLVGIGIGAVMRVSSPEQIARPSTPLASPFSPLPSSSPFVGRITGMVDCQWSDPQTAAFNGASIPLGRKYALASGLMEISYNTGAKVILQGPCTYEVESPAGGYLSLGKLTAKVDKKEEGRTKSEERSGSNSSFLIPHSYFAVRTPTATVTDLGTEFGVEVSGQGNTSAHVFHGSIKVQAISEGTTRNDPSVQLGENESVIVEKQSGAEELTVRRIAIDSTSFVRHEQLAKAAEDLRLKPFRRWLAYSRELRRDPSLLAYYDFQQSDDAPGVLPNVAANGDHTPDGTPDGTVEQAMWTVGRMAGKHALFFQNPSDCVKINLPQTVDDLTLAAWVNVTSLHQNTNQDSPLFNGLLMSENWNRSGQVHWQLDSKGRILLGQFGTRQGRDGRQWQSPSVFDQTRLRRWTHIATVLDQAARVRFYVDGQFLGEVAAQDPVRIPICIGRARIGVWNEWPRTFNGRVDELAIFGRALGADEIKQMFEAGNPAENHSITGSAGRRQRVEK